MKTELVLGRLLPLSFSQKTKIRSTEEVAKVYFRGDLMYALL